jgi:beta-phosphoglucomutase-like phosphatase (HAD superfamily)
MNKEKEQQQAYDSLYEFLTKRSGEAAGESERQRKRDRIKNWVTSSTKRTPSNMVQPVRVEDGSVIEDMDEPSKPRGERLENLLSNMPTLADRLLQASYVDTEETSAGNMKNDYSWFDAEKEQIQEEYAQICDEVINQIQEQRISDPEDTPENAEAIAESVITQEMKRMITSIRTARAKERLQDMEIKRMAELDARDLTGSRDDLAEKLLKEAADDWKRRDARQADFDDFQKYEREAFQNLKDGKSDFILQPDSDLDEWALERLEEMLEASKDGNEPSISDILEENIEDLQGRLDKESKKGIVEPQTMKEWQMYRAIATKLTKERGNKSVLADSPISNQDEVDEQFIVGQLNSWREYIGKEEDIRKRSGLTAGPKMPFDWQSADQEQDAMPTRDDNTKSRKDIRRAVNLQAIQALEDLVIKSDRVRAENLKKQLEILKAELEPLDYNDFEEESVDEMDNGPVDLSDLFSSRERIEAEPSIDSTFTEYEKYSIDRIMSGNPIDVTSSGIVQDTKLSPPPPPNTPFFSDMPEDTEKIAPPKTPFFSADFDEVDTITPKMDTKLGSIEEQKLRKMYRKAGARTKEEQDTIREQWESFQSFEKAKRDESGLSDFDDSSLLEKAKLKYDVADVMTGDGDFDAEKVLASIGPRPVRKKSSKPEVVDDEAKTKSDLDPSEVADALYRSVSAVGGGKWKDDPSIKDKEKSDFEDYRRKEDELRRSLDGLDKNAAEMATPIDETSYAEDALASMGPRPVFKREKQQVQDEMELSDRGGVYSKVDDEGDASSSVEFVPDWLKKERKTMKNSDRYNDRSDYFSGRDIDEVFDDDKYEHNLRQLAEYERRRSGKKQQMGIDISDVLGGNRDSDDYADYTYDREYFRDQQEGWGAVSFEARKANLLEYVELNAAELNNLIDHRDSTYSTGVSQYLPRINKPFSEFGAIFRLEGVIVDLTGLHQQVWTQIAKEFDFKEPMYEDIERAAVDRPEVAVREIFFWTNDAILIRRVTDTFRRVFKEYFDEWAEAKGIKAKAEAKSATEENGNKGMFALGFEDFVEEEKEKSTLIEATSSVSPMTEQALMVRLKESWSSTAQEFGFVPPSNEKIVQCSFLPPDIVVRDIFRWSANQQEIDGIVSCFSQVMSGAGPPAPPAQSPTSPISNNMDEGAILELQFLAWKQIAEEGSLDVPSPEEVLAASVLNDPEAVIAYGFGWTDDDTQVQDLASRYRETFSELVNGRLLNRPISKRSPTSVKGEEKLVAEIPKRSGPSEEEILASQIEAWSVVARTHELEAPTPDQIQLTMNMGANDSVRRLMGWTYNFNNEQINTISQTYEEALKKASLKYLEAYSMNIESVDVPQAKQEPTSVDVSADELYEAAFDAWAKVADHFSFRPPIQEEVIFAMSVGPEEAIISGFRWADDVVEANRIAANYLEEIKLKRAQWHRKGLSTTTIPEAGINDAETIPLVKVMPGVESWIRSLHQVEMGCGVESHLEDDQIAILLEHAGLSELLPVDKRVSCEKGYDRDSQQMLGVALRIERRPDHCVVFDSSPYANTAAQEIEMRCVSLVGPYPRYELLSADTSAFSFDELTAMNIRRLFGDRVYDQPMLDSNQALITEKKTKTRFWDPED